VADNRTAVATRWPDRFVHEPDFDPGVSVFGLVDDDLSLRRGVRVGFAHGFVFRLMFGILPDANITGNRRAYA